MLWCSPRAPRKEHSMSTTATATTAAQRRRWIALAVLCLGQLMMVLDATIVNVALPSIQRELHFTQANLTWVIDGYLITFGGFLLLAGRFGDLRGPQEGVPQRARPVRGGVDRVRARRQPGDADRRSPDPGGRRRDRLERDPRDHRHRVPGAGRAGQGDGHVRVRLRRRRLDRTARRRRAHAVAELALDLLRQRADRRWSRWCSAGS